MKKPNFFIIGAPKCGTTSLAAWLAEHPQIYLSPRKEPHFFNTDHSYVLTPSLREYERFFRGAEPGHVAVGEASVWYLYSEEAVANVVGYAPDALFVVCLRNPVTMAPSLYEQQVFSGNEHVESFGEAWRIQEHRLRGELVSRWCREPRFLAYGRVCSLGSQLERLYDRVKPARVLTLVLDDIQENPRQEYLRILDFLGACDDGRSSFPTLNPAKELRSPLTRKAVMAVGKAKRRLGLYRGLGVLRAIDRRNTLYRPRSPLTPELKHELQHYFAADVEKLSALLGRDLTGWLRS